MNGACFVRCNLLGESVWWAVSPIFFLPVYEVLDYEANGMRPALVRLDLYDYGTNVVLGIADYRRDTAYGTKGKKGTS